MVDVQLLKGPFHKVVEPVKNEAHLGKPAPVPPQPQYVRALGAALFARRLQQEGGAPC